MTAPIDGARTQHLLSRLSDLKRRRDDATPGNGRVAIVAELDAVRAELRRRAEAWTYRGAGRASRICRARQERGAA